MEKETKYICSWSGGKDSTATIILCHEKKLPLDLILFSEVMYDAKRGISGEHPEQIKWMKEYAIPLFEQWGYKTEILHSDGKKKDFLDIFHHVRGSKSKNCGKKAGYLISGRCSGNGRLKVSVIKKYKKQLKEQYNVVDYIGIAHDESERLERLGEGKVSLLDQYGINEEDTYPMCEKYGLLSPLYKYAKRGGVLVLPKCNNKRTSCTCV